MKKPKSEKPFNNPFADLKLAPRVEERPRPAPPPRPPARRSGPEELDEETLFRMSIGDVAPVRGGPALAPPPAPPTADQVRILDAEEEAFLQLSELVAGEGPFDLADTDEFMEASVEGLDARILKRLRGGGYAVQAHLDLHGLVKEEARLALERFVEASRRHGHRCVLVVHGRGLHSKDQIPVLKEWVGRWLTRGRLGKQVLAFATARPHDGGAGAVYVLLRR